MDSNTLNQTRVSFFLSFLQPLKLSTNRFIVQAHPSHISIPSPASSRTMADAPAAPVNTNGVHQDKAADETPGVKVRSPEPPLSHSSPLTRPPSRSLLAILRILSTMRGSRHSLLQCRATCTSPIFIQIFGTATFLVSSIHPETRRKNVFRAVYDISYNCI